MSVINGSWLLGRFATLRMMATDLSTIAFGDARLASMWRSDSAFSSPNSVHIPIRWT